MTERLRLVGLPAVALVLVGAVLGVQLANGGGTFKPLEPADPCVARTVTSRAEGIDGLTERLVLLGIDGAACRLDVSREALTLELAQPGPRTEAQIEALRAGLLAAVGRMEDDGTLPPASELVDEAMDNADLNGFLEAAIRALPDSVVDAALKTDDVLTRAIEDLDLRSVLENLDDQQRSQRAAGGRDHRGRQGLVGGPSQGPVVTASGRHWRLISPYTHESDTSPFTMQSSRNVPSRTNPSFSRTRADAALRVSASAWTRFRSSVSNAHCSSARAASVA